MSLALDNGAGENRYMNQEGSKRRLCKNVPGDMGGKLVRQYIKNLRNLDLTLPLTSHILCAVSTGADSIALAKLVTKYGYRGGQRVEFVYVDHGLRKDETVREIEFIQSFADESGVPVSVLKAEGEPHEGESIEAWARNERYRLLHQRGEELGGDYLVFTAHHLLDQAETVLWRLLSGGESHLGGILWRDGRVIRPLLNVAREDLRAFLAEEGQGHLEDSSNFDQRFQRNQIRSEIFPTILKRFPRAVENIAEIGFAIQRGESPQDSHLPLLMRAMGTRVQRSHFDEISKLQTSDKKHASIDLPKGWKLGRFDEPSEEKWILRRNKVDQTRH